MKRVNQVKIEMDSLSANESFARLAVAGFIAHLDPLVGELMDVKTAVSEAVTNAIIHGYEDEVGKIYITLTLCGGEQGGHTLTVAVRDSGAGIEDVAEAMTPLFTSKPHMERSGMGFTVMESFMDTISVRSEKGGGTEVVMTKVLSRTDGAETTGM